MEPVLASKKSRPADDNQAPIRGVTPSILIEQIQNTVPFIFEPEFLAIGSSGPKTHYLKIIQALKQGISQTPGNEMPHDQYYELCLSAHTATVGSFVPTDVDNQIRFRLWSPFLDEETLTKMADVVLDNIDWDFTPVSLRYVASPKDGALLGGHHGEWFSVGVGAYGAFRKRNPKRAAAIAAALIQEVHREYRILKDLMQAKDGIGVLKASYVIAHNLGDFARVMEMWNLPVDDPLREQFEATLPRFALASDLNKQVVANENHRHFALRSPKVLRKSADFLLPIGPFFDDWGAKLARHPVIRPEELGTVVEALAAGWERLPGTVGYARALAGIVEAFPGGLKELARYLPARVERNLKAGNLRTLMSVPKNRFEEQWARKVASFS